MSLTLWFTRARCTATYPSGWPPVPRFLFPDHDRLWGWAGQDPEGILGAPQGGHIARLEFRRRLERDSEAREDFERQVREEKERRRSEREVRA